MVIVPALIFSITRSEDNVLHVRGMDEPLYWLAVILGVGGIVISFWTVSLFFCHGDGTAAPWDPPKRLVVRGPYRYVRNPMIIGVILILFAEAIMLCSLPIAVWASIFLLANAIYFPFFEEPALKKRFGADYEQYCRCVGRWIPRATPWNKHSNPNE